MPKPAYYFFDQLPVLFVVLEMYNFAFEFIKIFNFTPCNSNGSKNYLSILYFINNRSFWLKFFGSFQILRSCVKLTIIVWIATKIYKITHFAISSVKTEIAQPLVIIGGCCLWDLSISQVIDHATYYKFECSHWWKIYLFSKKSFARFALQSECCNLNQ